MTNHNHQLLVRCRRGDARAWQQLVQQYAPLVHSIPVRYGLSSTEVDDIGQEVFLALAQGLESIEDPASLPAWLITTARRHSWRAIQKSKREQPLGVSDLATVDYAGTVGQTVLEQPPCCLERRVPSMAELLEGWHHQEILAQGMAKLGNRCQTLLTAVFLDQAEPSYEEISRQLAMPKGSIGPTRNRCLQQLRLILEGLGFTMAD